jgi:phosphocarrier protein
VHQATVIITDPVGLHARPAAVLVQTVGHFKSRIRLEHGSKKADARSIIQVLGLGVRQGSPVTVVAEGADEQEAVAAILSVLSGK